MNIFNDPKYNDYYRYLIMFTLIIVGFIILLSDDFISQLKTFTWIQQKGNLITISYLTDRRQGTHKTLAHYSYIFEGAEYQSYFVGFGRAENDFYPRSNSLVAYVNPSNPQESVLRRMDYIALTFCIIFIGMGIASFFFSKEVDKIHDLT